MGETFGTEGVVFGCWVGLGPLGGSSDSREPGSLRSDSQELMVCLVTESRVPVHVASVIPSEVGIQRKVGNGDSQLTPLEVIALLVTRFLRTAQEGRLADVKVPPEGVSHTGGGRCGKRPISNGVGEGVFLVRTPGTCGEPMFAGGHFFSVFVAGLVGGCPGWPISSDTDRRSWNVVFSGKQEL